MPKFRLIALAALAALGLAAHAPQSADAQDSARTTTPTALEQLLTRVKVAGLALDSLSRLGDESTGERGALLEEQIWSAQLEVQAALFEAGVELEQQKADGGDLSAARPVLQDVLVTGWPRYRRQLERRERRLLELLDRRDDASPRQRLEIETAFARRSERLEQMYRGLLQTFRVVERESLDVAPQRSYVAEKLERMAEQTRLRILVLARTHAQVAARAQRNPDDADAQLELEATSAALNQTTRNLEAATSLLSDLGKDVTDLKVALIIARGNLTSAIFEPGVTRGLLQYWNRQFVEMLTRQGPHWLFSGLMIVLIVAGFALLARVTRAMVRRAIPSATISNMMKETLVTWSSRVIGLIGLLVLLRQFGVQLGPMLAGLGIAGFVVGFALQDTLSNFAAGGMILAYHPYDIGDEVEAGGAMGIVKNMSLVSTTILTSDNQTLIVPNKKMWGDVIRNMNAQGRRRVDMTFVVGHENDVTTIERLLLQVANADERVMKDPPPVIKLHQIGELSLSFIVRVWARREHYWDVYWDITRAVKVSFDESGVKPPPRP